MLEDNDGLVGPVLISLGQSEPSRGTSSPKAVETYRDWELEVSCFPSNPRANQAAFIQTAKVG